jgi:hypothetical protein
MHDRPCDLSALKKIVELYPSPPRASQHANERELVRRSGNKKKVKMVNAEPAIDRPTDTNTSGFEDISSLKRDYPLIVTR